MDFENGAVRPATRETPGIGHRIARFARRRVRKRAFSRGGLTLLPPSPPVPFPFPRAGLRRAPVEPRRAEGHAPRAHRRVQDGRLPRLAAVQLEPAGARVRPVRHPPERRRQGADRRGRPRLCRIPSQPTSAPSASPDGSAQDALFYVEDEGARGLVTTTAPPPPTASAPSRRASPRWACGHAVLLVRVMTRPGETARVRARALPVAEKLPGRGPPPPLRAPTTGGSVSVSGRPAGAGRRWSFSGGPSRARSV